MKKLVNLALLLFMATACLFGQQRKSISILKEFSESQQPLKSVLYSNGDEVLLDESFEGDVTGWTYYNNDGDDYHWGTGADEEDFDLSHTGTKGAACFYNEDGNDDWLITPLVDLPSSVDQVVFSFWAKSHSADFLESFNVKLSNSGDAITDFSMELESVTSASADWTQYSYDLSAYKGQSIYIAIQLVSVNKWYLMVDDFLITASSESQDDVWTDQYSTLYNSSEAALIVRSGDIDNLGFGWAAGFDPFSGASTSAHSFPWSPEVDDAPGTDRIMVVSSYDGNPPSGWDGYTSNTSRPDNNPQAVELTYDLNGITVNSAVIQIFVDDFQAPNWGASYHVTIDGNRVSFLEDLINSLSQTGPIGKLISANIPTGFLQHLTDGKLSIFIDDPVTGAGDGFAIDFVRLLINPGHFTYTGTITGTVLDSKTSQPISNALVSASGLVEGYTNSNGVFTLSNVPAGLVNVRVSADGYSTNVTNVDLESNQTETVNVMLEESEIIDVPDMLTTSYGPPDNADEWVKYSIPLVAETFNIDETTFMESMKSIGLIRIRTEMRDGDDKGFVDEVSMGNLYSNFDNGNDGWGVMGDGTLGYENNGGYSGGCITIDDWASGDWHWAVAPDSWTGDLSAYVGGNFEFYFKTSHPSYSAVVEFHTSSTSRIVLSVDEQTLAPGKTIPVEVSLVPAPETEVSVGLSVSNNVLTIPATAIVGTNGKGTFNMQTDEVVNSTVTSVLTASASGYSSARLTFTVNPKADAYESTSEGGYWHNEETWVGGEVPPDESNVKINGPVTFYTGSQAAGPVSDLLISEEGILQVESTDGDFDSGIYMLRVLGDLTVYGNLKNNDGILWIMLYGDLANYGNVNGTKMVFHGEEDQYLKMSNDAVFDGVVFTDEEIQSKVVLSSNMRLGNCVVSLYAMNSGTTTPGTLNIPDGYTLSLEDSYIMNTIVNGNGNVLQSIGKCELSDAVTLSNLVLEGEFEVDGTTTFEGDSVVLKGEFYGGFYQDTVISNTKRLVNYGEISNNSFICNIKGDITSEGIWTNKNTFICGTSDQKVVFNNYSGFEFQVLANVDGAASYQWKKDGNNLTGQTADVLVLSDLDKGNNGIYNASTNVGDSRSILVMVDVPDLIANFEADVTNGAPSLEVRFTDMSEGNPDQWRWYVGSPLTESVRSWDQHPVIYFYEEGVFDISLVVKSGTRLDTITKEGYITIENGNGAELMPNKISAYPNPVKDVLTITWENTRHENGELNIIDQIGRVQHKQNWSSESHLQNVDVSGLNEGFYILEIRLEGEVYRSNFIKK